MSNEDVIGNGSHEDPNQPATPLRLRQSGTYTPEAIYDIQAKAELGRYRIRGFGILRERRWATFDDLTFIPCGLTRIPLEGYREKCSTKTVLGTRFAKRPMELDIPVMVTGMSFGALSYNAKVALARGTRLAGSSTTTGDGGMLPAERENSPRLVYEVLPSRFGINIHHMKMADAIELTIGQGAKPGTGGLLLESKVTGEIAEIRDLPPGVDQRSPARHPDFLGPDDMVIKIEELREATRSSNRFIKFPQLRPIRQVLRNAYRRTLRTQNSELRTTQHGSGLLFPSRPSPHHPVGPCQGYPGDH